MNKNLSGFRYNRQQNLYCLYGCHHQLQDLLAYCKFRKLYKIFFIRSVKFHNSFEYDNRCFNKKYIDCRRRFLIVDDSGNIRSFDDLTKAYRKHKMRHYGHYAYQIRRHVSNVQE